MSERPELYLGDSLAADRNIYAVLGNAEQEKSDAQTAIERILNPSDELPHITLRDKDEQPDQRRLTASFDIIVDQDKKIGYMHINVGAGKRSHIALLDIEIEDMNYRGKEKGYGRAAYKEAIKILAAYNYRLESNGMLSPGSNSVWQWLVVKGLAELIEDNGKKEQVDREGHKTTYFLRKYRMYPLDRLRLQAKPMEDFE